MPTSAGRDRLGRLWVVSGAPGSGKTAAVPHLVEQLGGSEPGGLAVVDMDELLTGGDLLGLPIAAPEGAPLWPAYNALWGRITGLIRRSGVSVLLLAPLLPGETALGPGEGRAAAAGCADPFADAAWLLLDCSDAERGRRLGARGWPPERVEEALADAAEARRHIPSLVDSSDLDPSAVARAIGEWLRRSR